MKKIGFVIALAALSSVPVRAGQPFPYYDRHGNGVALGHVSYCERQETGPGPSIVREGSSSAEPAVPNAPLAPGDAIATTGEQRCEVQFDTGTIVRLDVDTVLRFETVLAASLTSGKRLTNLALDKGRILVMYRKDESGELFQILTPRAAVRLGGSAMALVQVDAGGRTTLDTRRGSADVLYGRSAETTRTQKIRAGQHIAIGASHTVELLAPGASAGHAEFDRWNDWLNENFRTLHAGVNELPKPVLHYPPAVVEFAKRWSTLSGEWVWSDLYGYVWRPGSNADSTWRPYLQGQWTWVGSERFWVPEEPWGWVPYHLGYWTFIKKYGWTWIPGSAFSAAWVDFDVCGDDLTWRPWSFWNLSGRQPSGLTPIGLHRPLCPESWAESTGVQVVDLLAEPTPITPAPNPPPPRRRPDRPDRPKGPPEIKALSGRVLAALRAGDKQLAEELGVVARSRVVVPRAELVVRPDGDRAIRVGSAPSTGERMPDAQAVPRSVAVDRAAPPEPPASIEVSPGPRFRDWNPDIRAARDIGGTIRYSSRDNAVVCDGCRAPLRHDEWGNQSTAQGSNNDGGNWDSSSSSSSAPEPSGAATASPSGPSHDAAAQPRDN